MTSTNTNETNSLANTQSIIAHSTGKKSSNASSLQRNMTTLTISKNAISHVQKAVNGGSGGGSQNMTAQANAKIIKKMQSHRKSST